MHHVRKISLSLCGNSSIGVHSDRKLYDLEYADDVFPPKKNPRKLSAFLGRLNESVFRGAKCEINVELDWPKAEFFSYSMTFE